MPSSESLHSSLLRQGIWTSYLIGWVCESERGLDWADDHTIEVDQQPSASIANYRCKAKLAVGIPDGIVSGVLLKLLLHQQVATPGDY
jgi:hypothetical protein